MTKQNVNIVNFTLLYGILEEIKENLSFCITNYDSEKDFLNQENNNIKKCLTITNNNHTSLNQKDLLVFNDLPISLFKLIEIINIELIRKKYDFQSNININNYILNLNSKFFSKNNVKLKLTEKEIEIILYLNTNKKAHSVIDLQKNIWEYSSNLETHTVETHIYRLRKKINEKFENNNFIKTNKEGYFID